MLTSHNIFTSIHLALQSFRLPDEILGPLRVGFCEQLERSSFFLLYVDNQFFQQQFLNIWLLLKCVLGSFVKNLMAVVA